MMNRWFRILMVVVFAGMLVSCAGGTIENTVSVGAQTAPTAESAPDQAGSQEQATLTVMTHDSFAVSEEIIRQFEQENNVKINFLESGDSGSAVNRAILSKEAPMADILYGVDNTFLSRAIEAGIFETYASPALEDIPQAFKLDPQNTALPVDYGDVCINFDRAYFSDQALPVPATLQDLLKPEYKGLLVVENPATSSPGMAFLLSTIAEFGEDGYLEYWQQLRDNGLVVVNDWETAYYTNFSGSSGQGPQPMAVSYGSSPVAEVVFAEKPLDEAPTASIVGKNTCFRQVEFVGILKGTRHRALAEKFIDYMLSKPFQEDLPLQMFVFPVSSQAQLPEAFVKHSQISEEPAMLDPQLIADNRDVWIQAWTDTVLR